ncbi:MAG: hypothetical protein JO145_12195 [Acidobacteriaceae bacterium]|nr:hypothetical protein [Acidobacteriaceae bacterium]
MGPLGPPGGGPPCLLEFGGGPAPGGGPPNAVRLLFSIMLTVPELTFVV